MSLGLYVEHDICSQRSLCGIFYFISPVFRGVRVTRSLVLCICFVDRYLPFVLFLLAIVLSVLLRYTDSDYPFGIFKLDYPFGIFNLYLQQGQRISLLTDLSVDESCTFSFGHCVVCSSSIYGF
jgi:hypothetical protein